MNELKTINDNIPSKKEMKKYIGHDLRGYLAETSNTRVCIYEYMYDKKCALWKPSGKSFSINNQLEYEGDVFILHKKTPLFNSFDKLFDFFDKLNVEIKYIFQRSIKRFDSFMLFLTSGRQQEPRAFKNSSPQYCIMQKNTIYRKECYPVVFRLFRVTDNIIVETARYYMGHENCHGYVEKIKNKNGYSNSVPINGYIKNYYIHSLDDGKEKGPVYIKKNAKLLNIQEKLVEETKLKYVKPYIIDATKDSKNFPVLNSILENTIVESILKSNYANLAEYIKDSLHKQDPITVLNELFWYHNRIDAGYDFSETPSNLPLHKRLGIPSYCLGLLDKRFAEKEPWEAYYYVAEVKTIFQNEMSLFLSMDENSFIKIMCKLSEVRIQEKHRLNIMKDIFTRLMRIFCRENYMLYINYIVEVANFSQCFQNYLGIYLDYLRLLENLGDRVEKKWKFSSPEELEQAHDDLTEMFNIVRNAEIAKQYNEEFSEISDDLKKYEYTGEKFSVVSPKNAMDILSEGKILHHCVGTYLSAICNKETTIVFIRKNENLDEPFFTLEIRGNYVRQCHGKNNRNIKSESGMDEFLAEYCKKKDIGMLNVNAVLAV